MRDDAHSLGPAFEGVLSAHSPIGGTSAGPPINHGREDASEIPVEQIVEQWRGESRRGRYESAMWRASGLAEPEEPGPSERPGPSGEVEESEVDNATAGGLFQWLGRE